MERTSGLFFSLDLSAEATITSDLFLGTLRAVVGENLPYCGEKPTLLSLKYLLTPPAPTHTDKNHLKEPSSHSSDGSINSRREHNILFLKPGHQQTPSREQGDISVCTTRHLVLCGDSEYIAEMLIVSFHFFVFLPLAALL